MLEFQELVAQLRANNINLRQECAQAGLPGRSIDSILPGPAVVASQSVGAGAAADGVICFDTEGQKVPKI